MLGSSKTDLKAFPASAQDEAGHQLFKVQVGFDPSDRKPMPAMGPGAREIRIRDRAGAFRVIYPATRPDGVYVLHCFQKKSQKTSARDLLLARQRLSSLPRRVMSKTKKVRSVFYDLYDPDVAAEMEARSVLLMGLERWLKDCGLTQTEAAKVLGVTQARVSDIKRGKISQFSLDLLVRLAARAGLRPEFRLAA